MYTQIITHEYLGYLSSAWHN